MYTHTANPLLVDLEKQTLSRSKRAQLWFSSAAFADLDLEKDEEADIKQMMMRIESARGKLPSSERTPDGTKVKSERVPKVRGVTRVSDDVEFSGGGDVESVDTEESGTQHGGKVDSESLESADSDSSEDDWDNENQQSRPPPPKAVKGGPFEVVPMETKVAVPVRKLDPEGLALGALLVQSNKKREDIIEGAYNRWTHSDDHLPDWFCEDEAKFCQKQLPVTKEMIQEYRERLKEINARPIRKIAEAKARKKRKALKQMEKARKKAETITEAVDVTNTEKVHQIKQIYKKAGLLGKRKREVKYVVAKKGLASKRPRRPPGTKGPYKIVDPRMKKDSRTKKAEPKSSRQRKKSKKH